MRFEIAYGKAFAALALNRSSLQVLQKAKEKPALMQSLAERDDGIYAGGFRADGNFDPKAARRLNIKRDRSPRDPARGGQGTRAASHLPWEGPTLTPALAGADFP
jgi:hypothetical protein